MEKQNTIPDYALKTLARHALESCCEYLKDPKHQKEFEQWFYDKYGYKYSDRHEQHQK